MEAIHKHPIRLILISRSSLVMAKKCPIGGVWKGSGRCLGLPESVWGDMMWKQFITNQFDSGSLAYSLSSSCLRLVKTCYILGCL